MKRCNRQSKGTRARGLQTSMRALRRLLVLAAPAGFFMGSAPVHAQLSSPIDIALQARVLPNTAIYATSNAVLEVTLTNHGPTNAIGVVAVTSFFPSERLSIFAVPSTSPCQLSFDSATGPQGQTFFAAILQSGPLPAMGSVTCAVGVRPGVVAGGSLDLSITANGTSPGIVETNPSNNSVLIPLQLSAPAPVPALSWIAGLTLAFLLLLSGRRSSWRF